jgi:predicted TIM-barrel fold metal-dependent hydrolase
MTMLTTVRAAACLLCLALLLAPRAPLRAQDDLEAQLAAEIARIPAIDHHAHPVKVVRAGEKPDDEYDALPADAMEPFDLPTRLRPDNPVHVAAWRALYGYPYDDTSEAHVKELLALKERVKREKGDDYPAWVLDRLGIETMYANRVALGRGLGPPRFRWVPFDDALLFPLDNAAAKRKNPEYRSMYAGEEKLLRRFMAEAGVKTLPAALPDYLRQVVTPTLERQKRSGAVGIKFEAAYLRPLDFERAPEAEAARVYARWGKRGEPPAAGYKTLQDFLFHAIAREAGRLQLAVHFHMGAGAGAYFNLAGSDPLQLEPVVDDPDLRKTHFVLIHGGWPFEKSTAYLLVKPNVYADFSAQTFLLTPGQLAPVLRTWLTFVPEKVMFGTDAFTIAPQLDWEELGYLSNATARQALAIALTGMVRDGEINRARASELARMVLRENALRLYRVRGKE